MQEPLTPAAARDLARSIVDNGAVSYLQHAFDRLEQRGITIPECIATIRSCEVTDIRRWKGTWRYRFENETMAVVVLFRSESRFMLLTAYRPGE